MSDDERTLVALGGLLHDIGKFVQRSEWHEDCYTGAEAGYDFLSKIFELSPDLKERYGIIAEFSRCHSESDLGMLTENTRSKNLLKIISYADEISAPEGRADDEKAIGQHDVLVSILTTVNLNKGECTPGRYEITEFSPEKFFYPVKTVNDAENSYRYLFSEFKDEFEKAILNGVDFNHVLHILERYASFVPAMMAEDSDIPLYDHLKITSAISLCLYHFHGDRLDDETFNPEDYSREFILIGGDISGIQDFIYTITSRGALKYLRARSAYLELLTEDIVEELLEKLELTRANIVFSGGGRFYILAPNTERAKQTVKDISAKANEWLFDKFWGRLYLAIDFIEVGGRELQTFRVNDQSLWEAINRKIKVKKLRKFLDDVPEMRLIENYVSQNECSVCKAPNPELMVEGDHVCSICESMKKMGKELPKLKGFVRTSEKLDLAYYEFPFSRFYAFFSESQIPAGSTVFWKNGFVSVPGCKVIPYYVCDYYAKDQDGIKDFDKLSESSTGAKKIAVLRMDVDDLGKIFSMGIPEGEGSFSRFASVSRLLNHFFKNCVRLLAEGKLRHYLPDDLPRISSSTGPKEAVVVYSGGDDLFVVGAWNHVFELAFEISALFEKYVGNNPNITISAGYAIFDPKFPLYRMAEITGEREERAKEEGEVVAKKHGVEIKKKNRIYLGDRGLHKVKDQNKALFKESYEWVEFRRIWTEYITKIYNSKKPELLIRRSAIKKIFDARKEYLKNPNGLRWSVLMIYYLTRIEVKKDGRLIDFVPKLASRDHEKARRGEVQDIYFIDIPLKFVDLAVRGGG